jgi:hypothetical protein
MTSRADGATLSEQALKQILVFLHIIHSFVPEECILETELLKPTFDKQGGLEKLYKKVPMTEEEARQAECARQKISGMAISEMPFDQAFVLGGDGDGASSSAAAAADAGGTASSFGMDGESIMQRVHQSLMLKEQFHMQIVDVAEILLIPVCVSYVTPDRSRGGGGNGNEQRADEDGSCGEDHEELGDEKVSAFWMVVLKTRKCYNFSAHLHWLVANVDKEVCSFQMWLAVCVYVSVCCRAWYSRVYFP